MNQIGNTAARRLETQRRVLFVASTPNLLGGAEHCLVDIVATIASTEWQPFAVVPGEGSLAEALRQAGARVFIVDLGVLRHRGEARSAKLAVRLAVAARASRQIARIIREHEIAVVHSNTAVVIAGALAARRAGVPHVWHVRELLHGPVWKLLQRAMYAYSSVIVCISRCVADHVEQGRRAGATPVIVLSDGIDVTRFRPMETAASSSTVVMLSRIHPDKGHEEFIRAAALVSERVPDARFLIFGGCLPVYEPLRRRFEALIEELGLTGRLEMCSDVSRAEAATKIRESAVVVVPSQWIEPGGLVVLEAMASGLAVVAPDRGGPAEVIEDGVNGFVVPVDDPDRIADAVEQLLTDPDLRAQIGRRARVRIVNDFDVRNQVDQLVDLYARLTAKPVTACA